jgi:hypothetical protein
MRKCVALGFDTTGLRDWLAGAMSRVRRCVIGMHFCHPTQRIAFCKVQRQHFVDHLFFDHFLHFTILPTVLSAEQFLIALHDLLHIFQSLDRLHNFIYQLPSCLALYKSFNLYEFLYLLATQFTLVT